MSFSTYSLEEIKKMNNAMRLSVGVGVFLLLLKSYAYWITSSTAILSDAAESIVHVLAVGFAAYSMWLSLKPADEDHTYGHDRITFFSAGFEGAMIILAGLFIFYEAFKKIFLGVELENIDQGMFFIAIATLINGLLGGYLVRLGKKFHSLVLEADGKHILTDCYTSLGVIIALILSRWTGWLYFDPLIAILIGCNILRTGVQLIRNSVHGLMDQVDPKLDARIRKLLDKETSALVIGYHHLRHRNAGNRLLIEVHLLFPKDLPIAKAHELATVLERKIESAFSEPTEFVTHLEPLEGHDEIHHQVLGRGG